MRKNYQKTEIDTLRACCAGAGERGAGRAGRRGAGGAAGPGGGRRAAGDGRDDGSRRDRGVRAEGPPRRRTQRDPPRARARVGDPGRASGAGAPAADARHRRFRGAAGALLRAVLRHRGAGADGDGADAGRPVDPALPGRAGAGRCAHRAGRDEHLALGGVAPVRRGDRDRAGRAAGRGPVRAGSGRADDRRGALRRALLRGGAGYRHRRHQAPVGAGRGLDRERHPGHRADRRAARARPGRDPPDPGRARRVEGAAPRGAGRVRPPGDRSLPTAQDPQRAGSAAARSCARSWPPGCGGPTTPTPRWPPRPN